MFPNAEYWQSVQNKAIFKHERLKYSSLKHAYFFFFLLLATWQQGLKPEPSEAQS